MIRSLYILMVTFLVVSPGHGWFFRIFRPKPTTRSCPQLQYYTFTINSPYNKMPLPECFVPKFKLFNRQTGSAYQNGITISTNYIHPSFSAQKDTIIIVHGYNDKPEQGNRWMIDSTTNLLKVGDFNVILTDWNSHSAKAPWNYDLAASNSRVAGRGIRDLVRSLYSKGLSRIKTSCVGHSLGAQACGYAGQYLGSSKFGRITGLDPAGPEFRALPSYARLSKDDADFVDVIHTGGGSSYFTDYGYLPPMGHIDFYPNKGKRQPGCWNKKRGTRSLDVYDELKVQLNTLKQALENQQLKLQGANNVKQEVADTSSLKRQDSVAQKLNDPPYIHVSDDKHVQAYDHNNSPDLADTRSILTQIKDVLSKLQEGESDLDTDDELKLTANENQPIEKELDIDQFDLITEIGNTNGVNISDNELRENVENFVKENNILHDIETLLERREERGEENVELTDKQKQQLTTALDRIQKGFVASFLSCSHGLSTDFYVASIKSTCFKALAKCQFGSNSLYQCYYCHKCPIMGYYADLNKSIQGIYYLKTTSSAPYCV